MGNLDLSAATIVDTSQLIRKRQISPVDVVQSTLERIERLDPLLHAFTTVTPEYALDRARRAEQEIASGRYLGYLHGIPYTLKDVIATAGIRTTFGHPRFKDFKPRRSATVHTLLEEAGAILVGKVYSQLGRGDGPIGCFNPWDLAKSPGSSSSGSGSALGASLGLFSLGTDTGGSVRHPASNCNLVGMRATFGRISRFGVWAPSWSHDQAGPLAKTVEDMARVLQVLASCDPKDPVSINEPTPDYTAGLRDGISGLRVGVPVDDWIWKDWTTEEAEVVVRRAIGVLQELGAAVQEVALPVSRAARQTHMTVVASETPVYLHDHFSQEDLDEWREMHPGLERAMQQPFADYLHAQHTRAAIRQEVYGVLRGVDVIAMPTGNTVGDNADAETAVIRGREVRARSRATNLNGIASEAGIPAISVPCGFVDGGHLPVGLQLIGRDLAEGLLLRVAYAYEQATKWHLRRPPLEGP